MLKEKLKDFNIILASGSPRRQSFFEEMGIPFEIKLKPIKEIFPKNLTRSEITDYLAELKASAFEGDLEPKDILITSDTIVWHEGAALGKPADPAQASEMLKSLSDRTHEVITSVCFTTAEKSKTVNCSTRVSFSRLSDEEIAYYINEYRPFDKAGAYGIQEWIGLVGIDHIEGSYFNVVGLPTHLVYESLMEFSE